MTPSNQQQLDAGKLQALRGALHDGSALASRALADWLGKPSVIEIDSLEQLSLQEATGVLSVGADSDDDPVCCCAVHMSGALTGHLILVFDDSSGLALADLLLDQPPGTHTAWTEMARSAALETANILFCSYLNSLWNHLAAPANAGGLLPTPPRFCREFAESLLQFVLMDQAMVSDHIVMARTRFEIDGESLNWTLLFVPDAPSMSRLPLWLSESSTPGRES